MIMSHNQDDGEAHSSCAGCTEQDTHKVAVQHSGNKTSEVFVINDPRVTFVQDTSSDSQFRCLICKNAGLLDAGLVETDQRNEKKLIGKIHFICGLYSPQTKLLDLTKRAFDLRPDSRIAEEKEEQVGVQTENESGLCFHCHKPVGLEGWACFEPGCTHHTHLFCALLQRARAKALTKAPTNGQSVGGSIQNLSNKEKSNSGKSKTELADLVANQYTEIEWLHQLEDPRSHWYLPLGIGPQNAQFQEHLRTTKREVPVAHIMNSDTLTNSSQLLSELKIKTEDIEARVQVYASPLICLEKGLKNFFGGTENFKSTPCSPRPLDHENGDRILSESHDSDPVPEPYDLKKAEFLHPEGVYCSQHFSSSASFYCFCGLKQEINEVEEFESVYCEDCGTWFHQRCVGINSKEEIPETFQCQKCQDLGNIVKDFPKFLDELVNSIYPYDQSEGFHQVNKNRLPYPSLRWRNLLARDYMILLNLIWKWREVISPLALSCLQELMPFSLEGIFASEPINDCGDLSEAYSEDTIVVGATSLQARTWVELALTDIIRSRIREMFFQGFNLDKLISSIDISFLQESRRKIAQLLKNLDKNLKDYSNLDNAHSPPRSSIQIKGMPDSEAETVQNNGLALVLLPSTSRVYAQDQRPLQASSSIQEGRDAIKPFASINTAPGTSPGGLDGLRKTISISNYHTETDPRLVPQLSNSKKLAYQPKQQLANSTIQSLTKLRNEVLEPFSKPFSLYQSKSGWNIEETTTFMDKLESTGLLKGTAVEIGLKRVVLRAEEHMSQVRQHLQNLLGKLQHLQLFEIHSNWVSEHCLHHTLYISEAFSSTDSFVQNIVLKTGEMLRTHHFKKLSNVYDLKALHHGLKSNLLSAFFDFQFASSELESFLRTVKDLRNWEQSVLEILKRLKRLQYTQAEDLLRAQDWKEMLVTTEELSDQFYLDDDRLKKFKTAYPFYLEVQQKLIKSEGIPKMEARTRRNSGVFGLGDPNAPPQRSGIQDELMPEEFTTELPVFEAVFQEFIKDGVPLSSICIAAIQRECIRYKTDLFWKGSIRMTAEELGGLVKSLAEVAHGIEDTERINNLKTIEQIIDIVSDSAYPLNIEESVRIETLRNHYQILTSHAVLGPVKLKIERLLRTVSETENIAETLNKQRSTTEKSVADGIFGLPSTETFMREFMSAEITPALAGSINWDDLECLSRRLFLKNSDLQFFPSLKRFVDKVYLALAFQLIINFKPSEKAEVKSIILIEVILDSAKPQTIEIPNPLYLRRRDSFLALLQGVTRLLTNSKELTLPEFRSQVEDLLEKRSKMKSIPLHPMSCIRHITQLLDEADVLARMLRRVKVFRAEDINKKNVKLYRIMAEIVRSETIARLPLLSSERNSKDIKDFLKYFKEIDECSLKVEGARAKAVEVSGRLQKIFLNGFSFSTALPLLFELQDPEPFQDVLRRIEKYSFLEDLYHELKGKLEEAKLVMKHVEELQHYKKLVDSVTNFNDENYKREFQLYLVYLLTVRLKGIWFMSSSVRASLKILWVFNKLVQLIFYPTTLLTLEHEFAQLEKHPYVDDEVKKRLPYKKLVKMVEERQSSTKQLLQTWEQLNSSPATTLDSWMGFLTDLSNSSVCIVEIESPVLLDSQTLPGIELHTKGLKILQLKDSETSNAWKLLFQRSFAERPHSPTSSNKGVEPEVVFVPYSRQSNCWRAVSYVLCVLVATYHLERTKNLEKLSKDLLDWLLRALKSDHLLSKLVPTTAILWLENLITQATGAGVFQSSTSSLSPNRATSQKKKSRTGPHLKKEAIAEESSTTTRKDKKSVSYSDIGFQAAERSPVHTRRSRRASMSDKPDEPAEYDDRLRGSGSRKSSESVQASLKRNKTGQGAGLSGGKKPKKTGKKSVRVNGGVHVQSKIEEETSHQEESLARSSGNDENIQISKRADSQRGKKPIRGLGKRTRGSRQDTIGGRESEKSSKDNTEQHDVAIKDRSLEISTLLQAKFVTLGDKTFEDSSGVCRMDISNDPILQKIAKSLSKKLPSSLHFEQMDQDELTALLKRFKEDKTKPAGFLYGLVSASNNQISQELLSKPCWVCRESIKGNIWIFRSGADKKLLQNPNFLIKQKGPALVNSILFIMELNQSKQSGDSAGPSEEDLSREAQSSPKGVKQAGEPAGNSGAQNQPAVLPRRQSVRNKASKVA